MILKATTTSYYSLGEMRSHPESFQQRDECLLVSEGKQWKGDYRIGLGLFFLIIYLQQGTDNLNDVTDFPLKKKKSHYFYMQNSCV